MKNVANISIEFTNGRKDKAWNRTKQEFNEIRNANYMHLSYQEKDKFLWEISVNIPYRK